ncbi:MAG: hypothetical protein PWP45_1833 [Tepidanaerobacteraceae bacterium]|nr:hypothetical protein [Tepidanaerobacteraceae bacterium]
MMKTPAGIDFRETPEFGSRPGFIIFKALIDFNGRAQQLKIIMQKKYNFDRVILNDTKCAKG